MKKIVIAPDSFKGCLASAEVADACETAVRKVFPECEVVKIPVADGGEGTVDALVGAMSGRFVSCRVCGPMMHPVDAVYGISGDGNVAVMEMASASGLPLVEPSERNPLLATSYGTGQMIMDAISRGCRRILIGIGGSATNDGGMGMLQALGFRFLGADGSELGKGGAMLEKVCSIDATAVPTAVRRTSFSVACDVSNPFYGPQGAAFVFAPQKGADSAMVRRLDAGLRNFASVIAASGFPPVDDVPGAGAAGGLGGAFLAFLDSHLRPGIEMVLDAIDFDRRICDADLVITGEGKLDAQTCMGKTPYGVMLRARRFGVPTVAVGGAVEDSALLDAAGFLSVMSIRQEAISLSEAMKPITASRNIIATIERLLRLIKHS